MIDLALNDNGAMISLRDISERQGITLKYLEQIVPLLSRSGYLKSARGSNGGYCLSFAPEQYTIGDILRAVEGPLAPVACLLDSPNRCSRCDDCKTLPLWTGLAKTIDSYLDGITLAQLAEGLPLPDAEQA